MLSTPLARTRAALRVFCGAARGAGVQVYPSTGKTRASCWRATADTSDGGFSLRVLFVLGSADRVLSVCETEPYQQSTLALGSAEWVLPVCVQSN